MCDPAQVREAAIDAVMTEMNVRLEIAQHCLVALKSLDDGAETLQEWCRVRRGVMTLVAQIGAQVDGCVQEVRQRL